MASAPRRRRLSGKGLSGKAAQGSGADASAGAPQRPRRRYRSIKPPGDMIQLGPRRVAEPARGFLKPMDESMTEYLQVSGLFKRKKAAPAIAAWDEAAGPELSLRARAVSFRRGLLTIEVESSTLLSELRGYASEDLRARADALLEDETIRKLSFKLKRR